MTLSISQHHEFILNCRAVWLLFLPVLVVMTLVGCTAGQQAVVLAESVKAESVNPESIVTAALIELLKQPVKIVVNSSRDDKKWLLISGSVENPDGGQLDYAGTRFQSAIEEGAFESSFVALLATVGEASAYRLIDLSFGSTDSPLGDWQAKYSLSREWLQTGSESESLQWQ